MPFFTCCKLRKRKRISKLENLNSKGNELEQLSINNSANPTRNSIHFENEEQSVDKVLVASSPIQSALNMSCSTNGQIPPLDFHRRKISFVLPPLWHNEEFYNSKKEIECTNSSLNQNDSSIAATKRKTNVEVTTRNSLIPLGHLPQIDFQRHLRSALQPLFNNEAFYNSKAEIGCTNNSLVQNGSSTKRKANPVEVATQTSPIPSSRIPVPINIPTRPSTILSRRTPSPTQDIAVQTARSNEYRENYKTSKNTFKMDMRLPPLPPLSGKDYISPIDLGNRRNWPLIFSSMSSLDEE